MKTARFTDVVAAAGPPQVHSLWVEPGKDPALKRAVRDCRVMTLHQVLRGTRKDYGTVGLQADESSQILVFPKSLRKFGEARIVGIDYALIVQPESKDPVSAFAGALARKPAPTKGAKGGRRLPHRRLSPMGKSATTSTHAGQTQLEPSPPKPEFTRDELLTEIRRAVRELKAGKAAAAHERLRALI